MFSRANKQGSISCMELCQRLTAPANNISVLSAEVQDPGRDAHAQQDNYDPSQPDSIQSDPIHPIQSMVFSKERPKACKLGALGNFACQDLPC
eukprot:1151426-Pelagomonas_calceolata.AAC.6